MALSLYSVDSMSAETPLLAFAETLEEIAMFPPESCAATPGADVPAGTICSPTTISETLSTTPTENAPENAKSTV